MSLYAQAKELLYEQYKINREIVKDSDFHRAFVEEKLRHSLQVSGAGNGILRNEAYFSNRTADFIDLARSAIVLHDIFRFSEVRRWFQTGQKSDHGVEGAAFLKTIPVFNDIRITLPIKHHGHMIEALYADPEYQAIGDPNLKEDVKHIAFAVRDADKIANWKILTQEFEAMRPVWLCAPLDRSAKQGLISPVIWDAFCAHQLPDRSEEQTNADVVLATLAWIFDINYDYSLVYSHRLDLFNGFMRVFETLQTPKEICEEIKQHLHPMAF